MEISFTDAEFIKQVCTQLVIGYDHILKQDSGDVATAFNFLNIPGASAEKFTEEREVLIDQRRKAKQIIERINEEYGI